jgi:hypothetical protein
MRSTCSSIRRNPDIDSSTSGIIDMGAALLEGLASGVGTSGAVITAT